jgi:dihydrodipicolinate synthase/N-acetylneuraminate lyase
VTKNEIAPETFARLASSWPNLYLFKDTSGLDHIALADIDRGGVFFVRGAEGDYSRWISRSGTCEGSRAERRYDGLLLSSANVFAAELAETIGLARAGEEEKSAELSGRVSRVVESLFSEAAGLPYGNAFSNANRALDWVMAFGPGSREAAPLTHSGKKLPASLLGFAAAALAREGFESPRYEEV